MAVGKLCDVDSQDVLIVFGVTKTIVVSLMVLYVYWKLWNLRRPPTTTGANKGNGWSVYRQAKMIRRMAIGSWGFHLLLWFPLIVFRQETSDAFGSNAWYFFLASVGASFLVASVPWAVAAMTNQGQERTRLNARLTSAFASMWAISLGQFLLDTIILCEVTNEAIYFMTAGALLVAFGLIFLDRSAASVLASNNNSPEEDKEVTIPLKAREDASAQYTGDDFNRLSTSHNRFQGASFPREHRLF